MKRTLHVIVINLYLLFGTTREVLRVLNFLWATVVGLLLLHVLGPNPLTVLTVSSVSCNSIGQF